MKKLIGVFRDKKDPRIFHAMIGEGKLGIYDYFKKYSYMYKKTPRSKYPFTLVSQKGTSYPGSRLFGLICGKVRHDNYIKVPKRGKYPCKSTIEKKIEADKERKYLADAFNHATQCAEAGACAPPDLKYAPVQETLF